MNDKTTKEKYNKYLVNEIKTGLCEICKHNKHYDIKIQIYDDNSFKIYEMPVMNNYRCEYGINELNIKELHDRLYKIVECEKYKIR